MNCRDCGGELGRIGGHDGERSFTLYECKECGHRGGRATGGGIPDSGWGVAAPKEASA